MPTTAGIWRYLFFFQAEDGIRDYKVTGVQTCALPILSWIARREPCAAGPPAAKTAFTSVLSELTVYAPGRRAWPTTKICTERSWPIVTSSSKLRKLRDTAVRTWVVRS